MNESRPACLLPTIIKDSTTCPIHRIFFFFFNDPAPTEFSSLPLHDALPISPDRPAVIAVVPFTPPTIEYAEVDPAIRRQFHSACAARFKRAKWMIQPKIDPLHETTRDVTVVILQKDNAVLETGFAAEFVNFLDERLARFVAWMRLACEDKLDRPCCIVEQSLEPFLIAE